MNSVLEHIPRELNAKNIEPAISDYLLLLNEIPLSIHADNILGLLTTLKREKVEKGPYPHVTLFEAANRIMTDLTILFGVKNLLNGAITEIKFATYKVELGNEDYNDHDIEATNGTVSLVGEAFNVSGTFFQGKKTTALRKLRSNANESKMKVIMYNSDAVNSKYRPNLREDEFFLPVNIKLN
ncbi:MAG: hypothetical protein RLN90_01275 [Balneolaceae bacterium]